MRDRVGARCAWWLGALAFGGVVVTHVLSYFLVTGGGAAHDELLGRTGHGAWSVVSALGLGSLVAGAGGFIVRPRGSTGTLSVTGTASRLALLQMGGWLFLEAGERLFAGHGVGDLLTEAPVLVGLVVQLAVAFVGALLLILLRRTVEVLLRRRRPDVCRTPASVHPLEGFAVRRVSLIATAAAPRGPPLLS